MTGVAFLQEDIVCSNHDKAAIPKSWILLDSQSTVDVFSNKKLITNIRESKHILKLHCNAGKSERRLTWIQHSVVLSRWYCQHSITVQCKKAITFDSADGTGFTVHKEDGSTRVFKP